MNTNRNFTEEKTDVHSSQVEKQCGKKKALQWELWQQCDNMCSFCCLGKGNRNTSKERKLQSLSNFKATLDNFDSETYDTVGLFGGEFFQGQIDDPEVNKAFFESIEKLKSLREEGKLKSIWIVATLTKQNLKDLWKTLIVLHVSELDSARIPFSEEGVWVCTSWDPQGRFHTKNSEHTWENNVKKIAQEFPWVSINTSVILTQKVCEMYLNGEFVPKDFMKKHHTSIALNQTRIFDYEIESNTDELCEFRETQNPEVIDAYLTNLKKATEADIGFRFYPERRTFRKFLLKFARDDTELYNSIFNVEREADVVFKNFNDSDGGVKWEADKDLAIQVCSSVGRINNPNCEREPHCNKHPIDFATCIDSNACMICDRDQIWRSVHG